MGVRVFRDTQVGRELVGRIDDSAAGSVFAYDPEFVALHRAALGISHRLPVDANPYSEADFGAFFRGLLPEGQVYADLARAYQVPRNDYLAIIERLGCESIGALTLVSDRVDPGEYEPTYEPLVASALDAMREGPLSAAVRVASETRLSLSGAQSKVAWTLPEGHSAESAGELDWLVPKGTAASSHIIKLSARGEEGIALNELACSLMARACGIEVARVSLVPFLPGAIAVERYDRVWVGETGLRRLMRVHQEDFCQALGFAPYYKYQVEGASYSYPALCSSIIDDACVSPRRGRIEFAKRVAFNYAIGNSDAHLKNGSLLYDVAWTSRRLAPMYDVTCIPLTGYSTRMAFDVGEHRELGDIDERDVMSIATDCDVGLAEFDAAVREVVGGLEGFDFELCPDPVRQTAERIQEDAAPRLAVLRAYLAI